MVSRKEDKIDFNKLEIELASAVEADQRYWRENDAKLRAVQQKVATYDEFRCDIADRVTGTFVPTYFRSRERKFHRWNFPWNFRSRERK